MPKKYKQKMIDDFGYIYCENCKRTDAYRYSIHHIVYRSEVPGHPMLHNKANLINLCEECHNAFHGNKRKIRKDICIERGLEEIFNRKLYDRN